MPLTLLSGWKGWVPAPAEFLRGYEGFVHADGYTGYNPVSEAGATHVGCMMHVRRYFFEARLNDPERAHEALARIRARYAVEQAAKEKGLTGPALAAHRQQHAGPILTAFADWLADQVTRSRPDGEGRTGRARLERPPELPAPVEGGARPGT
jgi:hypothetical protein